MTSVTADQVRPLRNEDGAAHKAFVPLLIVLAIGLGLVLTFARVVAVWQTGSILDPDDAMRLVQVRNLLAGQNWFDMTVYRLDPPDGSFMHWSRVVDIPLAVLIRVFEAFMPVENAERLTRIVFPLALQVALYIAMARLAKSLLGHDAIMPTIFMVLLSGMALGQFQPGRIDHHAPQIVLLAFMLGLLVDAVKSRRAWPAAVAAGLASLSLAISLENLPFILTLWGLIAGFWIWHGGSMRGVMSGFAVGWLIALPLCFLATVGPARWFVAVPDAFSFGQLVAGVAGAVVCLGLAYLPNQMSRAWLRFVVAAFGAVLVVGLVALLAPASLEAPFAQVDPLVREIWLVNVHEAWSFSRLMQKEPDTAATFMLPLLLGLAGSVAAACWEKDERRLQWILVTGLCLMGLCMSLWLIRVLTSIGPIAPLGGVWAVLQVNRWLAQRGRRQAALWCFALLWPFAAIPWALVLGPDSAKAKAAADDCHASAAFKPFTTLPTGLVLAPIDAGSHLLAFTSHSVLAAPYHRNNQGNLVAFNAFLAPPDEARAIVMASGANYIAICPNLGETAGLAKRNPRSLAAVLMSGHIPEWLMTVSAPNTPYKIFTVRTVGFAGR